MIVFGAMRCAVAPRDDTRGDLALTTKPLAQATTRTWIVTDGRPGNERPCSALASALGVEPMIFQSQPRGPWRWLAPRVVSGGLASLTGDHLSPPWPDLLISAGRLGAGVSRMVRRASQGGCYTIQILDPRVPTRHFDQVIAPRHDAVAGDNVIETLGSLHAIDDEWLARARAQFASRIRPHAAPRVALLIGGPNAAYPQLGSALDDLLTWCRQHYKAGTWLLSTSPRTPAALLKRARAALADHGRGELYNGQDGDNPYAGYLAWADAIAVTPDSINMMSEALGVGVPVVTSSANAKRPKFAHFHQGLAQRGLVNDVASGAPVKPSAPLREVQQVADAVAAAYQKSRRTTKGVAQDL